MSARYPTTWREFSRRIRHDRAGGRCECTGECGLHPPKPEPRRCVENDQTAAIWARGIVVLTVAHLNAPGGPCQCDPLCALETHVLALCNRCHLRYDRARHIRHAATTRARKLAAGTLALFA